MMQPASPDPSPIYPEQDQMQTDNATEISSEYSEQPQIQISSPPHEPIQNSNELSPDKLGEENVVCRWNNCMSPFNSHSDLANHLSKVHIGWKRPDYYCEWDGCARRNIKSHSRFALLMHLRTHTGEKPFECPQPGCTQTFSRMDAMLKHKKSEHDEPRTSPVARVASAAKGGKPGRKVVSSPVKHQRTEETHETKSKRKKINDDRTLSTHRPNTALRPLSDDEAESTLSFQDKYRLAKAKLSYITQENEMLTDECNDLEKKLRRLRTERRILLDVLYRAEMGGDDDEDADKQDVAIDGEDDDDDDEIDDEEEL